VGDAPVAAVAHREARWGALRISSHSAVRRLVLRTQPRSALVPGGERETEQIGWSCLNRVVEGEGVIKFLTVRNLISTCIGGSYRKAGFGISIVVVSC